MLTKLTIENFKKFERVEIPLAQNVVFVGPNNSGKTTALQALALWDLGLKRWSERRQNGSNPKERPGVTVNRLDVLNIPVPSANQLWHDLRTRSTQQEDDLRRTENVFIRILVDGISAKGAWNAGMEFYYANQQSFYARPIVPEGFSNPNLRLAFLSPMSGLATVEPVWEAGRISVLLGEGQTAQVLRNLCWSLSKKQDAWVKIVKQMKDMFGVKLEIPEHLRDRGEITMSYVERSGRILDLSAAGRGFQQVLLLLAFLHLHENSILLLDEPDAHLEIIRQRQIYNLLSDVAQEQGSQLFIATHSEVVLKEAAQKHEVVAFVGEPHSLRRSGGQMKTDEVWKALAEIGFGEYMLAEQTGSVLYIEGSTDFAILKEFAKILGHPFEKIAENCFVKELGNNQPKDARRHFFGLREAKHDLRGVALYDRLSSPLENEGDLVHLTWTKREIENYFCNREVLLRFAEVSDSELGELARPLRIASMNESIDELTRALEITGRGSPWSPDMKVSTEFLEPLMKNFASKNPPSLPLRKGAFHRLAALMRPEEIDPEVTEKLDAICRVLAPPPA